MLIYILRLFLIIIFINIIYVSIKTINFKKLKNKVVKLLSKLNYFIKIKENLIKISKVIYINNLVINKYTLFVLSIVLQIISFFLVFNYSKLVISSIFLSIIIFFIPLTILEIINKSIRLKLKKSFSFLIISLQSFSKNENNIVLALKEVKSYDPIKKYIDNFNNLVSNGFSVVQAFDNLIKEVENEDIARIIYLLKLNYINGGNLYNILKESNEYLLEVDKIKQKEYEKQNNMLSILSTICVINLFLLFCFGLENVQYKNILLNTFIGKIIIDFNSFLYFLIYFYLRKIMKE